MSVCFFLRADEHTAAAAKALKKLSSFTQPRLTLRWLAAWRTSALLKHTRHTHGFDAAAERCCLALSRFLCSAAVVAAAAAAVAVAAV